MTERWGTCRSCAGQGVIPEQVTRDSSAEGFQIKNLTNSETRQLDGPHMIIIAKLIECGLCNGQGVSGDAFEQHGDTTHF